MAGPGRYLLPSVRIPDATSTEVAHLATLAEDVIEALPSSLTRSMSDLKELDAVLGGSLAAITDKLNRLLQVIYNEQASPQERLILLKEVAEDVVAFKLGGEDKIRVATGTCETILQHSAQLDMIASLLASLMPPVMVANMPASATPSGYPTLFPSFAAAANTATAHIARPRQDFFQPQGVPPSSHTNQYASAAEQVNAYRSQGRLQPLKSHKGRHANAYTSTTGQGSSSSSSSKRPYAQSSANDNKRAKTHTSNLAQSDVYADSPPKRRKTGNNNNASHDDLHLDTQSARMDDGSGLPSPAMAGGQQQHMTGYSPAAGQDKQNQKRRGGASNRKGMDYSPDISAASTPTLGATGSMQSSSRQPRRRAAQTSYYADDDEEDEPSAAEVASPAEDEDHSHLYGTQLQSNNGAAPETGRPQATKRRSGHSGISQPASLPQQQQQEQPVEEAEEYPSDEEDPEEQDDEGAHDGMFGSTGSGAATGNGAAGGSGNGREKLYCYCQSVSYGEMIGCDNDDCAKEWFHLDCLGLKQAPSGTWYCDECKAAMGNAGRRGRR